jgi:hypothetical protein
VSGGGIDGRPRAPGEVRPATGFSSRRRGVPGISALWETAGRTDDASSLAEASGRPPFKLGSSSASGSTSLSESISAGAEIPLDFLPDLGLALALALRGSALGSGSFSGDISIRYSGWWSESTQRRRPRCTPRSPAMSQIDYTTSKTLPYYIPTGSMSGRRREKMANISTVIVQHHLERQKDGMSAYRSTGGMKSIF